MHADSFAFASIVLKIRHACNLRNCHCHVRAGPRESKPGMTFETQIGRHRHLQDKCERRAMISNLPQPRLQGSHNMKTRFAKRLIVIAIVAGIDDRASAQSRYRVLPTDFNSELEQQMMRAYLRKQVHNALDNRLKTLQNVLDAPEGISTPEGQVRKLDGEASIFDRYKQYERELATRRPS